MKKIILTAIVFMGITATAQVKVGTDPTNLATDANLQVEGTTPAEQFVVLKNGNVGIGTTTPTSKLHVSGSSAVVVSAVTNDLATGFSMITSGNTTVVGKRLYMDFFNDSYASSGIYSANRGVVFSGSQSAGLNLGATFATGNIKFYSGGDTDANMRMMIESNGNVSIVNTPTITTATKVLVKEPVTNIISEQVVNGNSVSTTAVAAGTTTQAVIGGNTEHTLAGAGVIMVSPDGDKWKVTVGNGGVLTIVKAL